MFLSIIVREPKPLQEVGEKFDLVGWVSKSWLRTSLGSIDNSIFIDFLDIDGKTFMARAISVRPPQDILERFLRLYGFGQVEEFIWANIGFLEKSHGRITLHIQGNDRQKQSVFIPLIVPQFVPDGAPDEEIIKKHLNVGKRVRRLQKELRAYSKELSLLQENQRKEFESNFVENSEDEADIQHEPLFNNIGWMLYSAESDEKRTLDQKYKEALDWRGPLVRGVAGRLSGFVFRVYSDDHGKHFHVINKGRGVDARFSFPEIQLINYKNTRNLIGSKETEKIREYFRDAEHFKKLEEEFAKREDATKGSV